MRRATVLGAGKGAHAIADAAVCPGCSHPVRLHNAIGCVRGECDCSLSPNDIAAPAAAALPAQLQPPSARSVDLLDPMCGGCGHRRGKHIQAGSSAPCHRCKCRNFTAPEAPDAPATTAGPAPAMAAAPAGPAARDETGPDTAGARAGFGLGLKAPRRADPRPAAQAAPAAAAVVGGDSDADEAAVVTVTAVTPVDLTELAAAAIPRAAAVPDQRKLSSRIMAQLREERRRQGLTQTDVGIRLGSGDEYVNKLERGHARPSLETLFSLARALGLELDVQLVGSDAQAAAVPGAVAAPRPFFPFRAAAPAADDALFAAALMVYRGWWCARCSSRRLDPGACPDCKRALQPVHVAILPRELTL